MRPSGRSSPSSPTKALLLTTTTEAAPAAQQHRLPSGRAQTIAVHGPGVHQAAPNNSSHLLVWRRGDAGGRAGGRCSGPAARGSCCQCAWRSLCRRSPAPAAARYAAVQVAAAGGDVEAGAGAACPAGCCAWAACSWLCSRFSSAACSSHRGRETTPRCSRACSGHRCAFRWHLAHRASIQIGIHTIRSSYHTPEKQTRFSPFFEFYCDILRSKAMGNGDGMAWRPA